KDVAARLGLDSEHLAAAMGVTSTASMNADDAPPPAMRGSVRASAADGVYTLNPFSGATIVKVGGTTVTAGPDTVTIENNGRTTTVRGDTDGVDAGGVGIVRAGDEVTVYGGGLPADDEYHSASPGGPSDYVSDGTSVSGPSGEVGAITLPEPTFELPEPALA